MRKKTGVLVGVTTGVAVLAVAGTVLLHGRSAEPDAGPTTSTVDVELGTVTAQVTGKGAVAAADTAAASFTEAGTITSLLVSVGQQVTAGQDLATIDPASAQRAEQKAQSAATAADSAVRLAQDQYDRGTAALQRARAALGAQPASSTQRTADAEAALKAARDGNATAQLALERAQSAATPGPDGTTSPDATAAVSTARTAASAAALALEDAQGALTAATTDLTNRAGAEAAVREAEGQLPTLRDAVEQARRTRDDAQRDVTAATSAVTATTLKAPISGVVTAINGTVGSVTASSGSTTGEQGTVTAGAGLVVIADVSSYRVTAQVPEAQISSVLAGQAATLTLAGAPDAPITGQVLSVAPMPRSSSDGGVVTYPVVVALTDAPAGLVLGQTGVVAITTAQVTDVPVLPLEAVMLTSATEGTVAVRKDGRTSTVPVTVGLTDSAWVQVVDGVAVGDKVEVTAGPVMTDDAGDLGDLGGLDGGFAG